VTVRGIIFDLGWTLADFTAHIATVEAQRARDLGAFLRACGFKVEGKTVFADYGREMRILRAARGELNYEYPARLAMLRALRRHIPRPDAALLTADAMAASFEAVIRRWELYPDTLDTLGALRDAGYRLGCISNTNDGAHAWRIIDRCNLRPWLSPIYTSEEVGLRKPHPRIFQLVLDDWNLPSAQVVVVGDTLEADVQGAHNAGLRSVWVDRGLVNPWSNNEAYKDRVMPDATIQQLAELPDLLGIWDTDEH
jgi:putative hydrolase of the HAD superfamily